MPEQQNIEYKTSWRDEYLKWICSFANANGGTILIGRNDYGMVVDVLDYKRLLDEIPNKSHDKMGITAKIILQEIENWCTRGYPKLIAVQKANLQALGRSDDYLE